MYYYAYINESKIATRVYEMPVEMSKTQGFIEITQEVYVASTAGTEGSIIGMRWNDGKGSWEEVTKYYYAVLIEKKFRKEVTEEDEARYFVKEVIESAEKVNDPLYIQIDGLDSVKVGQIYNDDTLGFQLPEFKEVAFADTDQVSVDGTNVVLTDKLAATDEAVKALETKVNEVKDQVENIDIPEVTATTILEKLKTVDGASSGIDADLLDGKDSTYFATTQGLQDLTTAVNGKAAINHSHDYSETYAAKLHTHSEYALSNHTHEKETNTVTISGTSVVQIPSGATKTDTLHFKPQIESNNGDWKLNSEYLVVPKTGNYLVIVNGRVTNYKGSDSDGYSVVLSLENSADKALVRDTVKLSGSEISGEVIKWVNDAQVISLNAGEQLRLGVYIYDCSATSVLWNTSITIVEV